MEKKKFANKKSLRKWLLTVSGVLLTSVSLLSDIEKVDIQFSSPKALSVVMESMPSYFPDGQYLVSYTDNKSTDIDNFDYSKMVMVISLEARVARSGRLIGGLQPLLKQLSNFEYHCTINRTNPAYITAGIWIVEPNNPADIEELKKILQDYSVMYAFNDGSGFITLNNARMGKGVSKIV